MEDREIISLYFQRDEDAISETARKYGGLCGHVARNILSDPQDAEECVSETYLSAWNAIPPAVPENLGAYLCRITRNISLKRLRDSRAAKRGGGEAELAFEELSDCLSDGRELDERLTAMELGETINRFLRGEKQANRRVFIRRYWYFDRVEDIAAMYGFSVSKVKSMLMRTRSRLRKRLEKEGYFDEI